MRELLGDRVTDIDARQQKLRVSNFASGAEFRDFFKATYGPTIMAYRGIADDPASRSRSWTASWRPWATATSTTASWSGSTCSSPPPAAEGQRGSSVVPTCASRHPARLGRVVSVHVAMLFSLVLK